MPYTLSHIAAIMPLNKKPLVLSGLVIGCMSPDALYFVPKIPPTTFTHTLLGLMLFCLPVSLIIYALYHRWIKEPVASLFPDFLTQNYATQSVPSIGTLSVWLSLFAGAATHIIWDNFTHEYGMPVQHFPALFQHDLILGNQPIPVYKLLQYASTIIGGGIVLRWWIVTVNLRYARSPVPLTEIFRQSKWLLAMLFIAAVIGIYQGLSIWRWYGINDIVIEMVVCGMSTFIGLVLGHCLCWQFRIRHRANTN